MTDFWEKKGEKGQSQKRREEKKVYPLHQWRKPRFLVGKNSLSFTVLLTSIAVLYKCFRERRHIISSILSYCFSKFVTSFLCKLICTRKTFCEYWGFRQKISWNVALDAYQDWQCMFIVENMPGHFFVICKKILDSQPVLSVLGIISIKSTWNSMRLE